MKTDRTRGSGDDPERERLRSILRDWPVPGPPADLEQDLRRAFRRRRRSGRPRLFWLSLAAGLALVALLRFVPAGPPVAPAPLERPAVIAPPHPAPPVPPLSDQGMDRTTDVAAAAARTLRTRRAPGRPPSERDVIVEPGQAELLAQLGRRLRDVREAMPGAAALRAETLPAGAVDLPIQDVRVTDPPPYRNEWEAVEGEWPSVRRAVPGMEVRE
jgi:hypothetical protein